MRRSRRRFCGAVRAQTAAPPGKGLLDGTALLVDVAAVGATRTSDAQIATVMNRQDKYAGEEEPGHDIAEQPDTKCPGIQGSPRALMIYRLLEPPPRNLPQLLPAEYINGSE